MEQQNIPDSYGTGKAPTQRSRAPFVIALLAILLGTNLITAGFFFDFGQSTVPIPQASTPPSTAIQPSAEFSQTQAPASGLAEVSAFAEGQNLCGTGIILSTDGYILTNCAVVENADRLTVTLDDGRSFPAGLIGMDPDSDVAVLKISAKDLVPADFVPSDSVAAGDRLALFPFAAAQELTDILVEDSRRFIGGMERRIFPVNCETGSLLVDENGRLVAIGIEHGGALPISEAIALASELIFYGQLNAPASFGMEIALLDEAQRSYWSLPGGVAVTRVAEGGNAQRAGLQPGDVLLSIDGTELQDTESYWSAVKSCRDSEFVQVEIYRSGQRLCIDLLLQPEE